MGALHEGHLSLIRRAAQECDEVIVSIFVNPAQFGEGEDFEHYPRTIEADTEAALAAGANYIYAPTIADIYPDYPSFEISGKPFDPALIPGPLALRWEGDRRPGHFEGVVKVVHRLFDLVQPDKAYFGEKDFQQLRIVENMVEKLALPIEVVRCQTVRDENGLALSSRNRYLNEEDYQTALAIPAMLAFCKLTIARDTDLVVLLSAARAQLPATIKLDYLALVSEDSLAPLKNLADDANSSTARIIFAGTVGTARLIDNVSVDLS